MVTNLWTALKYVLFISSVLLQSSFRFSFFRVWITLYSSLCSQFLHCLLSCNSYLTPVVPQFHLCPRVLCSLWDCVFGFLVLNTVSGYDVQANFRLNDQALKAEWESVLRTPYISICPWILRMFLLEYWMFLPLGKVLNPSFYSRNTELLLLIFFSWGPGFYLPVFECWSWLLPFSLEHHHRLMY